MCRPLAGRLRASGVQAVTESSVAALLADRQHLRLACLTVISQISRTSGTDSKAGVMKWSASRSGRLISLPARDLGNGDTNSVNRFTGEAGASESYCLGQSILRCRVPASQRMRNFASSDPYKREDIETMRRTLKAGSILLFGAAAIVWSSASFAGRAADCAAEADRASRSTGSVLGGAGRGAAKGALFGAIVGDKKGAKRGAALGAFTGAVRRGSVKNNVYQSVYDSCMGRY